MCCLRYEASSYEDARDQMPKQGQTVITADGEGTVQEVDKKKKSVLVRLQESGYTKTFPWEEIGPVQD